MNLPLCQTYYKELTTNDVDEKCILCGKDCVKEELKLCESQTPSSPVL